MHKDLDSDRRIGRLLAEEGFVDQVTELAGGDEVAVLCAELRRNPHALANVNIRANMASVALNRLRSEGMGIRSILKRILVSSDPRRLLEGFLGSVEGDKFRHTVLHALSALDWNDPRYRDLDAEAVASVLSPQDFGYLINNHRKLLLKEDANLPFNADSYWDNRIRWYVGKRDYRRAWDEIGKASKGFLVSEKKEEGEVKVIRRFAASKDTIASLVNLLFRAMRSSGKIAPLREGERAFSVLDEHWRAVRSQKRIQRLRRRHPGVLG